MIKQWEINYDNNKVSMDCKIIQNKGDQYGDDNGGCMSLLSLPNTEEQETLVIDAKNNTHAISTTTSNDNNNTSLQSKSSVIIGNWDEIFDIKLFSCNKKQCVVIATNSTNMCIQEKSTNKIHIIKGHTDIALAIDVSPCFMEDLL